MPLESPTTSASILPPSHRHADIDRRRSAHVGDLREPSRSGGVAEEQRTRRSVTAMHSARRAFRRRSRQDAPRRSGDQRPRAAQRRRDRDARLDRRDRSGRPWSRQQARASQPGPSARRRVRRAGRSSRSGHEQDACEGGAGMRATSRLRRARQTEEHRVRGQGDAGAGACRTLTAVRAIAPVGAADTLRRRSRGPGRENAVGGGALDVVSHTVRDAYGQQDSSAASAATARGQNSVQSPRGQDGDAGSRGRWDRADPVDVGRASRRRQSRRRRSGRAAPARQST